jgi:hypothetical protein
MERIGRDRTVVENQKKTTMAGERETQRVGRRAKKASRWKLIATSATTRAAVPSSSAAAHQPASHAHYYRHSFSPVIEYQGTRNPRLRLLRLLTTVVFQLQRTLLLHTRRTPSPADPRIPSGREVFAVQVPLALRPTHSGAWFVDLLSCDRDARACNCVCVCVRCCFARGWRDGVLLDANGLLLREGTREREAPIVRNCREVM